MKKELRNFLLNESKSNGIVFRIEDDDDRTKIIASYNDDVLGYLIYEQVFNAYEYDFIDICSEEEFDQIFSDDNLIKIEHLEVIDKFSGVGTKLMQYAMYHLQKNGYREFYLNASPMGIDGLNKENLIMFYRKFGFVTLLDQGNNAIMYKVK